MTSNSLWHLVRTRKSPVTSKLSPPSVSNCNLHNEKRLCVAYPQKLLVHTLLLATLVRPPQRHKVTVGGAPDKGKYIFFLLPKQKDHIRRALEPKIDLEYFLITLPIVSATSPFSKREPHVAARSRYGSLRTENTFAYNQPGASLRNLPPGCSDANVPFTLPQRRSSQPLRSNSRARGILYPPSTSHSVDLSRRFITRLCASLSPSRRGCQSPTKERRYERRPIKTSRFTADFGLRETTWRGDKKNPAFCFFLSGVVFRNGSFFFQRRQNEQRLHQSIRVAASIG